MKPLPVALVFTLIYAIWWLATEADTWKKRTLAAQEELNGCLAERYIERVGRAPMEQICIYKFIDTAADCRQQISCTCTCPKETYGKKIHK